MENNDVLVRIRYAFDIKDMDMIEIFKLGGHEINREDLAKLLVKSPSRNTTPEPVKQEELPDRIECSNRTLEAFLNGFIILKKGRKEPSGEADAKDQKEFLIKDNGNVNNILLKKLKIALSLTSEDVLEILESAGCRISKGELSAVLRKEGHRNYRMCGDRYARNFLKGLALKYRKE